LAQVNARGEKRLGNPTNLAEAQRKGAESMKAAADAFAACLLPTIRDIQRHGVPSLRAIAETLNARGTRQPAAERGRRCRSPTCFSARRQGRKVVVCRNDHSCFARDVREII
jgi:hypothetical protein